ncbi:MAG: hypothetical protein ACRD6X_10505 [Pyrinomonadaceae bacterium]
MDIKDELENELLVAILIDGRAKSRLDRRNSQQLIEKFRGALAEKPVSAEEIDDLPAIADSAYAH